MFQLSGDWPISRAIACSDHRKVTFEDGKVDSNTYWMANRC
jgi:hypothetical protein